MKGIALLKMHPVVILGPANKRTRKHNNIADVFLLVANNFLSTAAKGIKPRSVKINKENKSNAKGLQRLLTGFCFLPLEPGTDPRFPTEEDGWWGAATG